MTILNQAIQQVPGFESLYHKIYRRMRIEDLANSTCTNYSRCLAHLALHYNTVPTNLSLEQVEEYLLSLMNEKGEDVTTAFKFAIYGLRYACKVEGKDQLRLQLPSIRKYRKLPVVLSKSEVTLMLNKPHRLKHRVLIALLYGCGLRLSEVRNLKVDDIDLERSTLIVRKTKNRKDRCMPMGKTLTEIVGHYLKVQQPKNWVFPGFRWNTSSGNRFYMELDKRYGHRTIQWAVKRAAQMAGIKKHINVHSLRHTFATHLLEDGVNILTIKELLGHTNIKNTMIYLHVAQVDNRQRRSPLDSLEGVEVVTNQQFELPFNNVSTMSIN